jgi:hypothetical protein
VPEANFLPARALRRRWSALRIMRELALCKEKPNCICTSDTYYYY